MAVVGPGDASPTEIESAEQIGRAIAQRGDVLVCGGLGGVMAAACRGAASAGGMTVGLLPGAERAAANEWVRVAIPTGLGELRNGLVVRAADVVVAVGGGQRLNAAAPNGGASGSSAAASDGGAFGTLSEVALALKTGVPVIGLRTWDIEGVEAVDSPEGVIRAIQRRA